MTVKTTYATYAGRKMDLYDVGMAPRYREIADGIRDAILHERTLGGVQLGPGVRLPTQRELERVFDVSRETIRAAFSELISEGLIESKGTSGMYVLDQPTLAHPGRAAPVFRTWAEQVRRAGKEPSEDFVMRIVPATPETAARLHLEPEALITIREVTRYVDDQPWSIQRSAFPRDVAETAGLNSPRSLEEGTIAALVGAGFHEVGWEIEVSARHATPDERQVLHMGSGVYLLIHTRTAWTSTRAVRSTTEYLPADRNVISEQIGELPDSYWEGE